MVRYVYGRTHARTRYLAVRSGARVGDGGEGGREGGREVVVVAKRFQRAVLGWEV